MPYAVIRHSVSSMSKPKDEEIDIIDVSEDYLEHRLNNHPGKSEQALYRFDRVERGTGGNEGRWLIFVKNPNTGNEEYVWVDESQIGKTVITHDSLKRVLSRVFYGVGIRMNDDELSKVAYTIQRLHPQIFAQKPSGNISKTTPKKNSTVNPPQYLKHALFTEVHDMDDYLEHHGVLGMKWGVRRYQNEDGSLTAEGRKHYNVKTINSTRMELAGAESDREKRTILTKATNKAMGDQVKGIVAGTGSMVAGSLAKQAVARAAAGTLVRNLVYDSLTGTSSLITSVIPAAVPAWAAALTTPVGQIALAAVGTAGAAKAIYGAYKSLKLNELAAEFDVSTNVNRIVREQTSVNSAVERGMQEYRENKANRMINALDSNNSAAYEKERNSIKDDYEKDRMEYVVDRVRAARQSGKYDMEFLEKGLDQNQRTGEDLEGKDLDEAYLRYLLEKEKS